MERKVGTISRGIRCPIIREGDDLAAIVVDSVLDAASSEGFELRDRDVISVTESGKLRFHRCHCRGCKSKAGRRDHRRYFPNFIQKPFFHLLKGNCQRRKEDYSDAQLSKR